MPGPLIDCYVISSNRKSSAVTSFLHHFMPNHEASFGEHDPAEVLGLPIELSLEAILDFLEHNTDREYAFYWRNRNDTEPYHAITKFCNDGSLIFGLSATTIYDQEGIAMEYLNSVKKFLNSGKGYWVIEQAPPDNRLEFDSDWKKWKN